MNLYTVAYRVAAGGNKWFHVTNRKLLKSILKSGLKKTSNNVKWGGYKTGEGVYLINNMKGANNYQEILKLSDDEVVIIEVVPPGPLLMDEDSVNCYSLGDPPSDEFMDEYPEAGAEIMKLIENGGEPNDVIIQVINSMKITPDPLLIDDGQGGLGALTARYPGNIPISSIVRAYIKDKGRRRVVWSSNK